MQKLAKHHTVLTGGKMDQVQRDTELLMKSGDLSVTFQFISQPSLPGLLAQDLHFRHEDELPVRHYDTLLVGIEPCLLVQEATALTTTLTSPHLLSSTYIQIITNWPCHQIIQNSARHQFLLPCAACGPCH